MGNYAEFIDPYDKDSANLFVRVEHLARYLYAAEFIRKRKLKRVLDCACGNGYGSRIVAKHAESVDAVDCNVALMHQTGINGDEERNANISYHACDLNGGLGLFDDGSFDSVTCFETLEHIEREEALLREFARVLRRGRWLLLSVPKAGYEPVGEDGMPDNPWHMRLYEAGGLRQLLAQCGFAVEKTLGQPYTNLSRANMESCRRDMGLSYEEIGGYFTETPESLKFFAKVWGWPTEEAEDKSSVVFMVCRKK